MTPFSKARLEVLSDGMFAIAMTQLVLELKVPDLLLRALGSALAKRRTRHTSPAHAADP